MTALTQVPEGKTYRVADLLGDMRFLSRITSVGLTPGAELTVVQNREKIPILLYTRDSMLAVSRREAENIRVEVEEG